MSTEYTKLSAKYNQLSSEERGKIEAYYEIGISISQIARNLRRSKSTVCEEIRRGKYKGKYRTHIAQNRAIRRRKESHKRFGDFEVDTVLSCRGGKSCLAVFVERQSRKYFITKMKDKSAGEMIVATMKTIKNQGVKTMTYDNGTENANHSLVNKLLNCQSFFCNAYHSWEKGSTENRNKILRQFFPKGTNFDLISDDEIRRVQNVINNRPMKVLNWHSPSEVFSRIRSGY